MKRHELAVVGLALLSAVLYLLCAAVHGAGGFALDDAWIHQVYARNLATRAEFAFFAGQPSAGSTSPLWTVLLALGYLLRLDFRFWTYLLGAVSVGASALVAARLADRLSAFGLPVPRLALYVSLFVVFEWHLAWGAVSGMEIPLFVFLSLFLLERFFAHERAWVVGLTAGLLTLTRPEGVVLATLVVLGKIVEAPSHEEYQVSSPRSFFSFLVQFAIGFGVLLVPYLSFNFATSGTILPNTFYAKNVEYAVLIGQVPFFLRWLQLLTVPWVGAQILLLPGATFVAISLVVKREWRALIPYAWVLLLPALYGLRLPVAYQHGRYEMPVVPFIALYGIWGTGLLFERIKSWAVRTTWAFSTVALLLAFWFLGATSYATDVSIIDCEMVQTARWVAANAPAGAVVAAHDIGALGYYYPRPFIDLAGLVTPEVIPFIRDEGRLREFLFSRQATFVLFFPDWYPAFASDPHFVPVYQTGCVVTRQAGGTNMAVYRLVQ